MSTGWRRISSRPESIREMSSSSAISRVTRSASASTVSSISRFWSSVNRSHLASSVAVKPLTEVSGERSSWATVAISSAWLRSVRRAGLGVAQRDRRRRRTGPGRAGRARSARRRAPPGRRAAADCARAGRRGWRARRRGRSAVHQRRPFEVLQRQGTSRSGRPRASAVGDAGDPGGGGVEADHPAVSSATTSPSGRSSGSMPSTARRRAGIGACDARPVCSPGLLVPTPSPYPTSPTAAAGLPSPSPY